MRVAPFWSAVAALVIMGFSYGFAIRAYGRAEYLRPIMDKAFDIYRIICESYGGFEGGGEANRYNQYDVLRDCCNYNQTCFEQVTPVADKTASLQAEVGYASTTFIGIMILVTFLAPLLMWRVFEAGKELPAKITVPPAKPDSISDISKKLVQIINVLQQTPDAQEISSLGGSATILRHIRNTQDFLNSVVAQAGIDNEARAVGDDESQPLLRGRRMYIQ